MERNILRVPLGVRGVPCAPRTRWMYERPDRLPCFRFVHTLADKGYLAVGMRWRSGSALCTLDPLDDATEDVCVTPLPGCACVRTKTRESRFCCVQVTDVGAGCAVFRSRTRPGYPVRVSLHSLRPGFRSLSTWDPPLTGWQARSCPLTREAVWLTCVHPGSVTGSGSPWSASRRAQDSACCSRGR